MHFVFNCYDNNNNYYYYYYYTALMRYESAEGHAVLVLQQKK